MTMVKGFQEISYDELMEVNGGFWDMVCGVASGILGAASPWLPGVWGKVAGAASGALGALSAVCAANSW